MRIIQAIAILVGLLAGVFLVGGQLLPEKLVFVGSGEFCRTQSRVYEALSTPAQIARWSLFTREAGLPSTHSETGGTDGWVRWTGDGDDGDVIEWRITNVVPSRSVSYVIDLDGDMTVPASAELEPLPDDGTRLRLSITIESDSIGGRWGMNVLSWLPGSESLGDVVDRELQNISAFFEETGGACPGESA